MALHVMGSYIDHLTLDHQQKILREESDEFNSDSKVRLADKYKKSPNFRGFKVTKGTKTPVNPAWHSPFVDKSLSDVVS